MYRSVSIAGEAERKMVKEIVRRARDPVKSRVVPIEIVEKYKKKLAAVETEVAVVLQEEAADRELAHLENRNNQLQNKLNNGQAKDPERVWFQSKKERQEEKKRLAENGKETKKETKKKQKKKAAAMIPEDPKEAKERKRMEMEANFLIRQSKRNRKQKKMTVFSDDAKDVSSKGKKGKAKSSFEINLGRKAGGPGATKGGGVAKKNGGGGGRGGKNKSFKSKSFK